MRTMPKAPALTTATACSRALTGAGATMAAGSQPCSGTSAALTPSPPMSSTKIIWSVDRVEFGHLARQGELDGAGEALQPHDADQKRGAAADRIGEIAPSGGDRFRVAVMHHQRPGRQRQKLVEDEERDQRARQRDAGGGRHAQAEEAEEPRQMRALPEIADGVDGGEQPQEGRQGEEQQGQRVDAQQSSSPGSSAAGSRTRRRGQRPSSITTTSTSLATAPIRLTAVRDRCWASPRRKMTTPSPATSTAPEPAWPGHHSPSTVAGGRPICSRS
jgi:hypothetical protein